MRGYIYFWASVNALAASLMAGNYGHDYQAGCVVFGALVCIILCAEGIAEKLK